MGHDEYRLGSLADDAVVAGLTETVRAGNRITARTLAYLAELDERKLFLERGFASLFEYCVEALGQCEATAWRQIAAARACRMYPRAFALVASGELHASGLSRLLKHLSSQNAAELIEACRKKSARRDRGDHCAALSAA